MIDTLLASPHYGERWGRHWLDVARYADSSGFEQDYDRPNAWRYRDYVIRAFNQDKPYDVFLKEQFAGDELDNRTDDTLIATGFLRAGPRVAFREKDNPERRYEYLDDLIATTGRGVLGLTVQCARCHNHKFDPIPQRDYYSLATTFFGYVETTHPLVPRAEAEAYEKKTQDIDARQARAESRDQADRGAVRDSSCGRRRTRSFPKTCSGRSRSPKRERTPGEQLLAQQVIEAVSIAGAAIDTRHDARRCGEEESARRSDRGAREGAAEADPGRRDRHRRRLPVHAGRRGRRGRRLPEVPSLGREGRAASCTPVPAATKPPPSLLPAPRRSERQRLGDEAGLRHRGDLWQPADRDSARRRPHVGPPAGAGRVARLARRIR